MTTTRRPFIPRRFRVVVMFVAACGLSCIFVLADIAGAGRGLGPVGGSTAIAETCLLSPQGCTSSSISGDAATIARNKAVAGGQTSSGGSSSATPRIAPSIDANALALLCAVLITKPWYCPVPVKAAVPTTSSRPTLKLSDLATFRPSAPALSTEPNGWGLVGLPVNFLAHAVVQTLHGKVLGDSVAVRFTPTSYRWSYGDGSTKTTTNPGSSWARLAQREFTNTATSHVYQSVGRFTATATVVYSVDYQFTGQSWVRVAGTVSKASTVSVLISDAGVPLLVARSCLNDPSAAGC